MESFGHMMASVVREGAVTTRVAWVGRRALRAQEQQFQNAWSVSRSLPGWFKEARARAMFAAMIANPPKLIVEIGSYLGKSTVFLATAADNMGSLQRLVAIDPHTGDRSQLAALDAKAIPTFDLFSTHIEGNNLGHLVEPIVATSAEAAHAWAGDPIDFVFIDGWHSFDAVMEDGRLWLPHLARKGRVVFDDSFGEVREAVEQLASEGLFNLWGYAFGQAFGGDEPIPPEPLRQLLASTSLWWSRRLGA
jgi:MMP 1-O-methyltransferase